ncbi:MAG: hypothetical protein HYZ11_03115 [Candidatus Tectomicrobia bacterium]|uniref:Uncharacterized protein n=1 Tax=Tectimicrobiota bacterium TaxID=2528274 RepID=A0A932HZC5_UNCTE|nr:hypothetical protein [Candidatus Tectomicrobia bacterium]
MNDNRKFKDFPDDYKSKIHQEHTSYYIRGEDQINQAAFLYIKHLFLLNGGGAVAVLSYKGATFTKLPDLSLGYPLLFLTLGLIFSAILVGVEYLRLNYYYGKVTKVYSNFISNRITFAQFDEEAQNIQPKVWYSILLGGTALILFILGIAYGVVEGFIYLGRNR